VVLVGVGAGTVAAGACGTVVVVLGTVEVGAEGLFGWARRLFETRWDPDSTAEVAPAVGFGAMDRAPTIPMSPPATMAPRRRTSGALRLEVEVLGSTLSVSSRTRRVSANPPRI